MQDFLGRALTIGRIRNSLMVEEYTGILAHLVTLALEAKRDFAEPSAATPIDFAARVRAHLLFAPVAEV